MAVHREMVVANLKIFWRKITDQNVLFLTRKVHTYEEKKSFDRKIRCIHNLEINEYSTTKTIIVVYSSADSCRNAHIYTHLPYHNDSIIETDARRKRQEDFFNNILPLNLLQGSKGLFKGLHVRGCWRPNINFIFLPHCYDRHVVSFLFS